MCSSWGVISFWSFLVFSPSLLSLCFNSLFISVYQYMYFCIHYCYCCLHYYLLLLLFPLSSQLSVTGAWVGAGLAGGWDVIATWVPGHPTSMWDSGVKLDLSAFFESWFQKRKAIFIENFHSHGYVVENPITLLIRCHIVFLVWFIERA